jgi:DNA-binding NarL/FixJ family response regulator
MVASAAKCVLIVDDHKDVRQALRSLFDANGFAICGEAVNGRDATHKAQELHPDLILLDLSMPVMNGLEAARELTKLMPEIPILMFTNHAGGIREEDAQKIGISSVMSKNEAYGKLMSHARKFLD